MRATLILAVLWQRGRQSRVKEWADSNQNVEPLHCVRAPFAWGSTAAVGCATSRYLETPLCWLPTVWVISDCRKLALNRMVKCDNCSGAGTNSGKKYKCMVSYLFVGHQQLPAVSRLCVAEVSRTNLPMLVGPTFVGRSHLPIYL